MERPSNKPPPMWRWLVLMSFASNSFLNGYMWANFTPIPDTTKQLFGFCESADITAGDMCRDAVVTPNTFIVTWTYGIIFVFVLPVLPLVVRNIDKKNWLITITCLMFQFVCAWLRFMSVVLAKNGHFSLARIMCLVSSASLGFPTALIITCFAFLSQRWFPPRERTFANCIAVCSNYGGWALACLVMPYFVNTMDAMVDHQLAQAIIVTLAYLFQVLVYREWPTGARHPLDGQQEDERPDVVQVVTALLKNKKYCVQAVCFSMITGASYAVPGFSATALTDLSLAATQSAWINFAYVFSGTCAGLLMGKFVSDPKQHHFALKGSFSSAAVSLFIILLVITHQSRFSHSKVYVLIILCNAVFGAASLGPLGIVFSAVVETTRPIGAEFSGGLLELFIQLWSFGLLYISGQLTSGIDMFIIIAIPLWTCTLLMFTAYPLERNYSGSNDESLTKKMLACS